MKSITVRATALVLTVTAAMATTVLLPGSAQATEAKQLTSQQLKALGFQTQAQAEQALNIVSASLDDVTDVPSSADLDVVWPPTNAIPSTTPIPQAPTGAGAGGTWNPNPTTGTAPSTTNGTPVQQNPTAPANGANGGQVGSPTAPAPAPGTLSWNAAINAITGLDINGWIAIGTTFVHMIASNQPVATVSTPSISILPQSQPNWSMMSGWGAPVVKRYHLTFYNGFKQVVVSIPYIITFNANGGINGVGHYIANLRAVMGDLTTSWAYKVDVSTETHDAVNIGTANNPIPGVSFDVKVKVHTVIKDNQIGQSFFVSGDGRVRNCSAGECN